MTTQPEVELLRCEIDRLIEEYSKYENRKVRNIVRKLKRCRNKFDVESSIKYILLADKIRNLIDDLF